MKTYDPDILKSEIIILKSKEEELVLELEEIRATSAMYQHELSILEEEPL